MITHLVPKQLFLVDHLRALARMLQRDYSTCPCPGNNPLEEADVMASWNRHQTGQTHPEHPPVI